MPSSADLDKLLSALGAPASANASPAPPSSAVPSPKVNPKRPRESLPPAAQATHQKTASGSSASGGLLGRITSADEMTSSSLLDRLAVKPGSRPSSPAPALKAAPSTSLLGRIDASSIPPRPEPNARGGVQTTSESAAATAGGSLTKRIRLDPAPPETDLEREERRIRHELEMEKAVCPLSSRLCCPAAS